MLCTAYASAMTALVIFLTIQNWGISDQLRQRNTIIASWFPLTLVGLLVLAAVQSRRKSQSEHFERMLKELKHDENHAEQLGKYDFETFSQADQRIAMINERIELRLGLFVGGRNKITLFSALAIALTLIPFKLVDIGWWMLPLVLATSLAAGFSIAALRLQQVSDHLSYERDLIALAIRRRTRSQEEKEVS